MAYKVIIPNAGESVTSANVAQWHKSDGDFVKKGDTLLTIETDKVSQEIEAEGDGVLRISIQEGEEVAIGTVVAEVEDGEAPAQQASSEPSPAPAAPEAPTASGSDAGGEVLDIVVPAAGESVTSANVGNWLVASGSQVKRGDTLVVLETDKVSQEIEAEADGVVDTLVDEGEEVAIGTLIGKLTVGVINGTPVAPDAPVVPQQVKQEEVKAEPAPVGKAATPAQSAEPVVEGRTTRKKMTMLRRKIASHLVNAQQTAAILTTFNEVDMSAIMRLRKEVQEDFVKKHGCKLGFMSLFVKAVTQALKDVPSINGRIDGTDIIQNHYYDIGVAVGTEKGLVVPVIRDCDQKSFAEIEQDIIGYAEKAREGKIEISDLQGGVFTISNGGVYGSLLSTPILNPPQSGILGMHTIQQRPVAVDGKVEIRPMMYLALSYDHRLVDGKEAVSFLIRIKDCLENPVNLMLDI